MSQFLDLQSENIDFISKQSCESRDGDWICIKCNNLNFSFRKRCNRCKIQTRQQNDENLRQVYQYYQQYYLQVANQGQQHSKINSFQDQKQQFQIMTSTSDNQISSEQQQYENSLEINLPSVSPIVKRYTKDKNTPKTQVSQGFVSQEQMHCSKQFLHQYCWQNILIDQDVENELFSRQSNDFWDTQIEKLVQNIVI